jgi:hypothetical protein
MSTTNNPHRRIGCFGAFWRKLFGRRQIRPPEPNVPSEPNQDTPPRRVVNLHTRVERLRRINRRRRQTNARRDRVLHQRAAPPPPPPPPILVDNQINIDALPAEFLEPVKLTLKPKEFSMLIKRKRMGKQTINELKISDCRCAICQYDIKSRQHFSLLDCGHIYHIECSRQWFTKECIRPTCPTCRTDVRDKNREKMKTIVAEIGL